MRNRKSKWAGDEGRQWPRVGDASPSDSNLATARVWQEWFWTIGYKVVVVIVMVDEDDR